MMKPNEGNMDEKEYALSEIKRLEKALKDIIEYDEQRAHRFCPCHQIAKDALSKSV